jgi:hypothetical protein
MALLRSLASKGDGGLHGALDGGLPGVDAPLGLEVGGPPRTAEGALPELQISVTDANVGGCRLQPKTRISAQIPSRIPSKFEF